VYSNGHLMFTPKLRRTGMTKIRVGRNPGALRIGSPTCRSYGAWLDIRGLRTIPIALLTELYSSRSIPSHSTLINTAALARCQGGRLSRFSCFNSFCARPRPRPTVEVHENETMTPN